MRQRSEALLRKYTGCKLQRCLTRARHTRASGFCFFAFTSSLLRRISLKTSILRVKIPLFPKTDYLSLIQRLRGEDSYLHLGTRGGRAAARQKRRSKMPLATAARRVKGRSENITPLIFTRNTLYNKQLQRYLTRIYTAKPSPTIF